ncbi:DUF1573 domain-containing protein [Flaviaesturariibacter aridisoli]|uniref:DUF1573 domain-containing protein n=1 Tax=Flaviaesturariibacter aridisoli TaxID=2545761 RepID=A0A4R4E243_9BACT|nr:DUF1573 domain-containing protein [Flaviaesturariibacter aridisoli]TCZ72927.1 DUF1573 domain-containing protein [Flaviaesturariibacter aridisoli]
MKRFLTLALFVCLAAAGRAQDASATDPLQVKEAEFNFGKIPQGKPVFHFFEVVNSGATPLVLSNVQASCGCTTPEWDKEHPIAPGGKSTIKVGYNAAAHGAFEKFITISYNGSGSKIIKIKGEVWQAPAGAAPANASVDFLKQQFNN